MSHNDQACVPDLLREALTCLDQVNDADGTVRRLKTKVCIFSWIPTLLSVVQLVETSLSVHILGQGGALFSNCYLFMVLHLTSKLYEDLCYSLSNMRRCGRDYFLAYYESGTRSASITNLKGVSADCKFHRKLITEESAPRVV